MARISRPSGFAITITGAAILAAILLLAPSGAATSVTDTAGINVLDTASGGPLPSAWVALDTTCGAACKKTLGDETTLSFCPSAPWSFHWSGGVASNYAGGTCSSTNRLVAIHSNGFISFNSGTICSGTGCYTSKDMPNTGNPNGAIFASWHDLYPSCSDRPTAGVFVQESGVSPNRILTIEYFDVPWALMCGLGVDGHENFEFKLYESDNHVEVLYGAVQLPGTTCSSTGLCSDTIQYVRIGDENGAGTVGTKYYGGVGIFSPPANIGLQYKDIVPPVVNLPTLTCNLPGLSGWCRSLSNPLTITDNGDGSGTTLGLGVKARQVLVDGASVGSYVSGTAQTLAFSEGNHAIQGVATDWSSNAGTSTSLPLKIDIAAPSLTIGLTCTTNNAGTCVDPAHLVPSASDALSGVGSVACTLDGQTVSCSNGSDTIVSLGGHHTFSVTATDVAGNSVTSSKTFDIITDTIAPVVSLAASCTSGNAGWCLSIASIAVSATDDSGAISTLACALDGATVPCTNGGAVSVASEGLHTLTATATDAAGNVGSASASVKIDTAAPSLGLGAACGLAGNAGFCRGAETFDASGSDATSGLASLVCTLDGNAAPCSTSVTVDGAHTFVATATDAAGNSATRSLGFSIDATSPVVSLTQSCASPGALGWCLSNVAVSAGASDATSGLASFVCSIDGATAPCDALGLNADGTHGVSVTATDVAGNTASSGLSAKIDQTVPTVSLAPTCSLNGNAGWCRATSFALATSASDATSGLASLVCTIDGNAADCAAPVSGEGAHSVSALATDLAGNSATQSFSLSIDSIAPTVGVSPACALAGNSGWCRADLSATASASDATSGLSALSCAIDGAATSCEGLSIGTDGAHTFSAHATDAAGNVADALVSVKRDATAPSLSASPVCSLNGNVGWCRATSFAISASGSDATSGLSALLCTVDGTAADCGGAVSGEGAHSVVATATDAAGNAATQSFSLSIDSIAPTVGVSPSCALTGNAGWCRGDLSATASASDATSGLSALSCAIDGAATSCEGLSVSSDGAHTFSAHATDAAGNAADALANVKRDATAPSLSASPACSLNGNAGWCRATSFAISASGSDATSGLAAILCTVDGHAADCGAAVSGEGAHSVVATATDAAGNAATTTFSLSIDSIAPTVGVTPACALAGEGGWCRGDLSAAASASDATSGLAALTCAIDGAAAACNALAVSTDGAHSFSAHATDAAGNAADALANVQRDATAPTTSLALACAAPGTAGYCLSATFDFAAAGSDATSGLGGLSCVVDATSVPCSGTVGGDGLHQVAVTARDAAGNTATQSATLTLDANGIVTTIAPSCATPGNGLWCRAASLSYDITASAPTSGVASLACTLDAVSAPCSGSVSGEGLHTLAARAVATSGATSSRTLDLGIDSIAPVPTIALSCATPGTTGWCLAASLGLNGAASDATSGLASATCAADGAAVPCATTLAGEGAHAATLTATDAAGNVATASAAMSVDSVAPVVGLVPSCDITGNDGWCRGTTSAAASSSDATSGIASAVCKLDGTAIPCDRLASAAQGDHTMTIDARDVAGNAASAAVATKVDSLVPTTSAALTGPVGLNEWFTGPVDVALTCADAGSGCAGDMLGVDGADATATSAASLLADGDHTIVFHSVDAAGNVGDQTTQSFRIDQTPPTIGVSLSGTPGTNGWFRSQVTVTLTCDDATSGVPATGITYAIGNGAPQLYAAPFLVAAEGANALHVSCADNAGNLAKDDSAVKIDTVAPAGTVTAPMLAANGFDVAWTAGDSASGLVYVEVQALSNLGLTDSAAYQTACATDVTGAAADGVCHIAANPGYQCYRIVVLDQAGNLRVGPTLDPGNIGSSAAALGSACTVKGTMPGPVPTSSRKLH